MRYSDGQTGTPVTSNKEITLDGNRRIPEDTPGTIESRHTDQHHPPKFRVQFRTGSIGWVEPADVDAIPSKPIKKRPPQLRG